MVAHRKTSETNPQELAELMVGRPIGQPVRTPGLAGEDILLDVRNLMVTDARGVLRVQGGAAGTQVRLISARLANRRERRDYEG